MGMSKNGPIISVHEFLDNRGMKPLIESQANVQTGTVPNRQINGKDAPKVIRKTYVRINQPKK